MHVLIQKTIVLIKKKGIYEMLDVENRVIGEIREVQSHFWALVAALIENYRDAESLLDRRWEQIRS